MCVQKPACPCWKALSLFLNREGRTKSQPRASSASSFLRSGSWRRDSSLILILVLVLVPDGTGRTCTDADASARSAVILAPTDHKWDWKREAEAAWVSL